MRLFLSTAWDVIGVPTADLYQHSRNMRVPTRGYDPGMFCYPWHTKELVRFVNGCDRPSLGIMMRRVLYSYSLRLLHAGK